jgi:hypothetical protein
LGVGEIYEECIDGMVDNLLFSWEYFRFFVGFVSIFDFYGKLIFSGYVRNQVL